MNNFAPRRSRHSLRTWIAMLGAAALATSPVLAANSTWNVNGSATWQSSANWNPAAIPNAAGDTANLTNNITTNTAITLDGAVTLGTLNIGDTNGSNTFTLSAGTGGSLIMNNSGAGAALTHVSTGAADTISAGISLADNLTVSNLAPTGATNQLTFSGVVSGGGNLTMVGPGQVTLSGANTYTGVTQINSGTLVAGNATALGNATSAILLGNTTGSSNASLTFGSGISSARNITVQAGNSGVATVTLGANASVYTGTITLGSSGVGHSVVLNMNGGSSNAGFENAIVDPAGLTGAAGTVTINETTNINYFGSNGSTYTGGTIINNANTSNAYLSFDAGHIFGTGNVTINNLVARQTSNLTSHITGTNTQTWNGDWTVNGGSGGTLFWDMTGAINLGSLSATTANVANAASATRTLTINGATALGGGMTNGSNGITNSFALSSTSTNILTLNGVSTYTGSTTVGGGILRLGGANRLPTGTSLTLATANNAVSAGGELDLAGFNQTVASLASSSGTGAKGVVANSATATTSTLSIAGAGAEYDGLITGNTALALASTATGTETLTGSNSFTGGTTVNGGTLLVNGAATTVSASAGTGTVTTSGNTLTGLSSTSGLSAGQTVTSANLPAGTVITAITGSNSVTLSNNATASASGASVSFSAYNGSALGTGAVTVNSGGTLGGGGTIKPAGGAGVTINSGATLASGSAQTANAYLNGGNGAVNGTGTGGGLTLDNTEASSSLLTINGGAKLTFALGSTTAFDGGSGALNFANPNTDSTFLNITGSKVDQIFSNTTSAFTINLIDLTAGAPSGGVELTLRAQNPYLLIQTALGNNSDFANLMTTGGLGQNGYITGVSDGNGHYTPFNLSAYDINGNLISSSTNLQGLQLYLYNGDLEVVPEPGTWALMIGGLALLVVIQRRRNNKLS